MSELILVILVALGIAAVSNWLQPRFMATTFGTKLQTSQLGILFASALVILAGIFASTLILGLLTDRDEVVIASPTQVV